MTLTSLTGTFAESILNDLGVGIRGRWVVESGVVGDDDGDEFGAL